ncbi:sensor histidine kinase [Demequina lutea]|uniref:histidine kinase n=1 Tax=Demequina lutea TaxID=431489 RepID=A0A7Z0CGZ2_9MICO|nr:histidine kinase [Demequina lutea]NYI40259.1 signal transduction histidine kinase [Demequina lutea]
MKRADQAQEKWFRRPLALIALIVLASAMGVAAILERGEPSPWPLPTLIGLFYATQYLPRPMAIGGSLFASASFFAASVGVVSEGALSPRALLLFQVPLIVGAIGIAIGTQRDYRLAAEERALRAEESRDSDSRRRVADERLRIARDLHDVIAHHMAVIKVQSSAAQHLLRDDPDAAAKALANVVDSSRDALEELHVMVGVLRSEPDDDDESTRPAPGLGQLDALIAQSSAAGLAVRRRDSGAARPLSPTLDLVAYRIVQEALTNAGKHGDATADVSLSFDPRRLTIVVSNPIPRQVLDSETADGEGFGLVGMRERAAAVGGTLSAGRSGGFFVVTATLPAANGGEQS